MKRGCRLLRAIVAAVAVAGCAVCGVAGQRPGGGSFLEGILAIPSVSSDVEVNNEAVRYVKGWLDARGVYTAVVTNEARRAALYASTVPGKEHDVVFVTHLDVVPPLVDGQFEPRIEGDRIYGRGACDTKGNVAVIAQTLANLAGTCSVGAVFATDEEGRSSGTPTPTTLLNAGFVPKKFIIVGDTNGEFVDSLSYAEKGHFIMRVVARGKGGHSSMPWVADNPVPKLMRALGKIMELYPEPTADEDHWRDHVIPTGLTGAPANNIIPDVAEMAFSCRVTSPDSAARIKAQVEKATGLEVTVPKKFRPPVLTDPENEFVKSLFAAMRVKWPEKDIRLTRMSCATDATRYVHLGLPTVIFGATGGGAHASDEWVSLKSVEDYAAMFTDYLRALPANGATLPPGNWHEPVRDALQRMIDRHANDPDAYAVFDFDNTCAVGDCEHAALGYMIDNLAFAFSPDELPVLFLEGMPDPDRPLEPGKERATARKVVADCADLYRELLEMKSRRSMEEVRKTDAFAAFAAKMRYLRKRISRTFGSGFGYQWSKRFYCRMTSDRIRDTVRAALDAASADGRFRRCVWRTPTSRAGRSGCVEVPMFLGFSVPQEVKDLVNALKESGIAVYIVSGSFQDAVLAGSDGRYGVAFPKENVFGIHMKRDAEDRLVGWSDDRFPLPWSEGKPDVIRNQIAVSHHGRGPVLVAGDANGDYAMLTAFNDMEAGLVFDTRPDADSPLGRLIADARAGKGDGRYLIQGRDENLPGLRKSSESILVPQTILGCQP